MSYSYGDCSGRRSTEYHDDDNGHDDHTVMVNILMNYDHLMAMMIVSSDDDDDGHHDHTVKVNILMITL